MYPHWWTHFQSLVVLGSQKKRWWGLPKEWCAAQICWAFSPQQENSSQVTQSSCSFQICTWAGLIQTSSWTWKRESSGEQVVFLLSRLLKNLSCTNMWQLTCNAKQQVSIDNDEFPFWKSEHFNFLHCWVASGFHTGSYNAIQLFSKHQCKSQQCSTSGNAYTFWPVHQS